MNNLIFKYFVILLIIFTFSCENQEEESSGTTDNSDIEMTENFPTAEKVEYLSLIHI